MITRAASRLLWGLLLLTAALTLFASTQGAMEVSLASLWFGDDEVLRQVWFTIRLPRVLLALLIGAALALSGCVMQGLFRNPLADPGLLGISSGAALVVCCWLVLPLSVPVLIALYAPLVAAFIAVSYTHLRAHET